MASKGLTRLLGADTGTDWGRLLQILWLKTQLYVINNWSFRPFQTTNAGGISRHLRWIVLTQYGEEGLGGLDRHGEERAGVLALIRQADVTDFDRQLLPGRSHQLDPVIP